MSRHAEPRWHRKRRRWFANIGPPDENGRAREVYAPATIGEHDKAEAWAWMVASRERLHPPDPVADARRLAERKARERAQRRAYRAKKAAARPPKEVSPPHQRPRKSGASPMPRPAKVHWCKAARCWRSSAGGKDRYFHDLAPNAAGRREAERLLAERLVNDPAPP